VFARLLALPDDVVLKVLALVMAETLVAGSALVEAAGVVLKPDVGGWWGADDTFLGPCQRPDCRQRADCRSGKQLDRRCQRLRDAEGGKEDRSRLPLRRGAPAGRRLPAALMAFPVRGYDPNKTLQNAKDWEII
jgi:ParB family chromosome partitioning protein